MMPISRIPPKLSAIAILMNTPLLAAPSTATFINVMTVCAAGSQVTIDASLQGSIASTWDRESTKGKTTQQIVTEISKLLPQGEIYSRYLACVKDLMPKE